MIHSRPRSSRLLALGLSLSLTWGCNTSAVLSLSPAARRTPAAPATTAPASVAPVTLNGNATFQGSPLAGYSLEVYDAKSGKPLVRKTELVGVTTLALLDQNLTVGQDGKFAFQVAGLGAGQALRVVCRSASGVAKLETLVLGDRQALKYKIQQARDITIELNELTTALSHSARGVLTSSQTIKPEAASAVLSRLAGDLESLSAKFENVLKSSPAFAGELVRASTPSEQANAMRSLVENAGVLRQLTQLVADRISEISQQAHEAGNQNPEATSPEIQAQLRRVDFLGTRIAGQLDNKAVELIFGDTRQAVDGSDMSTFITQATANTSSGGSQSAPTALSEAQVAALLANLNNQDADTSNDNGRINITPAAIAEVLDLLTANRLAFEADWEKFLALAPEDLPPPEAQTTSYTQRQQIVGRLVLDRVFRRLTEGSFDLDNLPPPAPYASLQEVQTAFHEAVVFQTHMRTLYAAVKAALPDVPSQSPSVPQQEAVLRAFSPALLGQLKDDFTLIDAWRMYTGDVISNARSLSSSDTFLEYLYDGETLAPDHLYIANNLICTDKATLSDDLLLQVINQCFSCLRLEPKNGRFWA